MNFPAAGLGPLAMPTLVWGGLHDSIGWLVRRLSADENLRIAYPTIRINGLFNPEWHGGNRLESDAYPAFGTTHGRAETVVCASGRTRSGSRQKSTTFNIVLYVL